MLRMSLFGLLAVGVGPVQAQYYNPYFNPYYNAAMQQQQAQYQAQMYYTLQAQAAQAQAGAFYGMPGTTPHVGMFPGYNSFVAPSNPYTSGAYSAGAAALANNPYTPYGGVGAAAALTNPYSPNMPFGGYGGYNMDPYGRFGAAAELNAYGNYTNQVEQARILREQARQAQIETAKKKFDYDMYIKANTPTFTQEQAKIARSTLKRIQNNSTPAEISSGKAMNIILDDIRKQLGKKVSMDPILFDEDTLKNINVIKDAGNLGLVRDHGKFTWPVAFQTLLTAKDQKRIEVTTQELVQKAFKNQVDANLILDLTNMLNDMRTNLSAKVNEIPTTQYLEAKRFLNDFDDARLALERNEAATYLRYREFIAGAANGNRKRIDEIADYLVQNGLKLAPATSRDEAAYRALYSALVAYDVALNTQGGVEVGAGDR